MSATTWALQLAGIFIFVIYNVRMGYPVSTYLDFAALSVQATILLTLICVDLRVPEPLFRQIGQWAIRFYTSYSMRRR